MEKTLASPEKQREFLQDIGWILSKTIHDEEKLLGLGKRLDVSFIRNYPT
jgi:hypothetical protein